VEDLAFTINPRRRIKKVSRDSKAKRDNKVKMDNKDSLDSLVSRIKEMVKASQVKVVLKDSRMVRMTTEMDNSAIAPTTDLAISLIRDKDNQDKDLIVAVLKHRDPDLKMGLVMNVAEELISLD
jgi:hypothetical protein